MKTVENLKLKWHKLKTVASESELFSWAGVTLSTFFHGITSAIGQSWMMGCVSESNKQLLCFLQVVLFVLSCWIFLLCLCFLQVSSFVNFCIASEQVGQIHDQLFFCRLLLACHVGCGRSSSVWTFTSDPIFTKTLSRVDLKPRFQQEQAPKSHKGTFLVPSHKLTCLWSGHRVWKLQFCLVLVSIPTATKRPLFPFAANSRKATTPTMETLSHAAAS